MRPNSIVSCQSKKSYPTKEVADKTVDYLFKEKNVDVYSYRCNICETYHLSSKKER